MVTADTKQDLKNDILYNMRHGLESAIRKADLLKRCGLSESKTDDRILRLAIKELRQGGERVGLSVSSKHPGYYFIETAEELLQCMATLKGYCVEAAITRRDLKRAGYSLMHPGQLPLWI